MLNHGRTPRGTMFYRLILLASTCMAFGMLAGELLGSYGNALFSALFVWCACSICTQRLHDIGYSGWALTSFLIPVLGPLWLIFKFIKPGVEGSNRYGEDPMTRKGYLTVDISL
jgi:uncharacterized membrane protein YhaH (DUF805 family)